MSAGKPWRPEEEHLLFTLKEEDGITWAEIGEALGRSKETVRSKYRHMKREGKVLTVEEETTGCEISPFDEAVHKAFYPELEGEEVKTPPDWQDLLRLGIETKRAFDQIDEGKDIRTVRLKGAALPPIIVFSADWHLGSRATDYVRWLFEVALISRTPNTFLIDLGDDRQNMRRFYHLQGVLSQVLPPTLQAELMVGFVREMTAKGKYLAKVGGTHDEWMDEKIAGEMLLMWLYRQERIIFFENKGLLNIIVDFGDSEKKYPHLIFHKSRYSSFLSTLHGNRREYQLTFPGKVVAGAHDHIPGLEAYFHYNLLERAGYDIGGLSWNIKVGPLIDEDRQFRDYSSFFSPTMAFCPACVYTEQGIVALPSLKDALAYRASLSAANQLVTDFIQDLDVSDEDRNKLLRNLKYKE